MKCNTRDFGEIEFSKEDIIEFIQPPFGFEEFKNYVLLFDDEDRTNLAWLQSIDNADLCFVLINTLALPSYNPKFPADNKIGDGDFISFAICVITDDVKNATANLKSPIIINENSRLGTQIILNEDYPIRYYLVDKEA